MTACDERRSTRRSSTAGTSGDTAVDLTLAFNSIGWEAQNFLFNALDAIVGDPLSHAVRSGEQPATTTATITGSTSIAAAT